MSSSADTGSGRGAGLSADEMLAAALDYARAGIPIFPVGRNRMPIVAGGHGHKDATKDEAIIKRWWSAYPQAQIAMPTGSASGFDVIDLDRKKGKDGTITVPTWDSLTPLKVKTQSGGLHLYFKASGRLRSTGGYLGLGVDTRGENAYVVVPPSAGYDFIGDLRSVEVKVAGIELPSYPDGVLEFPIVFDHNQPAPGMADDYDEMHPGLFLFMAKQLHNGDLTWEEWANMGMTIWAASEGKEYGKTAFFDFSRRSDKYTWKETNDRWEHWSKSSPPTQKTMGSFVYSVKQANPDWERELDDWALEVLNEPVDLAVDSVLMGFEPAPKTPTESEGVSSSEQEKTPTESEGVFTEEAGNAAESATNREPSDVPDSGSNDPEIIIGPWKGSAGKGYEKSKEAPGQASADDAKAAGGRSAGPTPKSAPNTSAAPPNSEIYLAETFCQWHGKNLRYVSAWGFWMLWDGKQWKKDETLFVEHLVKTHCKDIAAPIANKAQKRQMTSSRCVSAVERLARSSRAVAARVDQWDADIWILNTPGGVLDLRSGELRPAEPEDYCTKITTVTPAPGDCPLWREHLAKVMHGDDSLVAGLHKLFGYSLCGSIAEDVLAFFYGTGANGKTSTINTIARIMGDYHHSAPAETFMISKGERHPTELAMLRGARLVTAVETEGSQSWAEAKLKQLTGGDPITARFMRQDFFTYIPQFTLVISGNHKPGFRDVDEAIRRRVVLYPFTVRIPDEEQIDDMEIAMIEKEGPQILQWIVNGCLAWQASGLDVPDSARVATDEYLAAEDLISTFAVENCLLLPAGKTLSKKLYARYVEVAEERNEYVQTMRKFLQAFEDRAEKITKTLAQGMPVNVPIRRSVGKITDDSGEYGVGFEGLILTPGRM